MVISSVIHILVVTISVLALNFTAAAEPDARLVFELNKLEQRDNACRFTFLLQNKLGARIDRLDFELALFDSSSKLSRLVSVSAGTLPIGKTRVRQFDIAQERCTSISHLLLNTIVVCKGEKITTDTCLERAQTRSTINIPLGY